jgi:Ni/Co efflux regulator RcnB
MRKILISLLLASAAASPAIAGPRDFSDAQQTREDRAQAREDRAQAREERSQAREERSQARDTARVERSADRPSFTPNVEQRQQSLDRSQTSRPSLAQPQVDGHERSLDRSSRVEPKIVTPPSSFANERIEQVQKRLELRQQERELRQSNRPVPNVMRSPHPPIVSDTPSRGTQPPLKTVTRTTPEVHWSTNWRHNSKYDWQNWRRHHHSWFHLGFYYDPYGWGYYPYQIGWRLWPSYYSSSYWINDPWYYRLPYAPPGYVWVRYWNDALLVDTWTGTVVDMIPNFFW